MTPIEENPLINRQAAARLKTLGVTLEFTAEDASVLAQFPTGIYLDQSADIFKQLHKLGRKGYDKKSLSVETKGEVVKIRFKLLALAE